MCIAFSDSCRTAPIRWQPPTAAPRPSRRRERRLARMVGCDVQDAGETAWWMLAQWFAELQIRTIMDGAMLVLSSAALPADARSSAPVLATQSCRRSPGASSASICRSAQSSRSLPTSGIARHIARRPPHSPRSPRRPSERSYVGRLWALRRNLPALPGKGLGSIARLGASVRRNRVFIATLIDLAWGS